MSALVTAQLGSPMPLFWLLAALLFVPPIAAVRRRRGAVECDNARRRHLVSPRHVTRRGLVDCPECAREEAERLAAVGAQAARAAAKAAAQIAPTSATPRGVAPAEVGAQSHNAAEDVA